jgi:hypothetical protein
MKFASRRNSVERAKIRQSSAEVPVIWDEKVDPDRLAVSWRITELSRGGIPKDGGLTREADSSLSKGREVSAKPMRRESQQVMSELIGQLRKQLNGERVAGPDAEQCGSDWGPGIGRGDAGEGSVSRTQPEEVGEFFRGLAPSRVAIEEGTHSAWMREVIAGLGSFRTVNRQTDYMTASAPSDLSRLVAAKRPTSSGEGAEHDDDRL